MYYYVPFARRSIEQNKKIKYKIKSNTSELWGIDDIIRFFLFLSFFSFSPANKAKKSKERKSLDPSRLVAASAALVRITTRTLIVLSNTP